MALARWQRPVQDGAGNIVLNGYCEVRREDAAGTPLAVLYSDRDGAVPLGNPFAFADGQPAFHAVGASYRVRVYGAGFDNVYHYQAVGTGAEVDTDSLLIPGYLFEFETATTEPPTVGCIRADNADLSAADHLYISKTTIAGVNVAAGVAALASGQLLLTSTSAGQQTEFHVDSVTDDGAYYELAVSSHLGATAIAAGRVGLQKQGATGPAGASGAIVGTETIYTAASNSIGVVEAGKTLIANRATAIAFNLDAAATLGSTWMAIVKNIGAGTLTLDPNGAELIDGASTATLLTGESALIVCNSTGFRTVLKEVLDPDLQALAVTGVAAFSGLLNGLTLSNNGADATNDIDVAAGIAIDSTNAKFLKLAAGITKRLDAAWAVGTGNGGLDTGSIANTTYHVWLITRSDTGVVDVLFSTSATSPTMPANYDYKRRIGSILRAGSAIVAFKQYGDFFMRNVPTPDVNNENNPGTSAALRSLSIPTGVQMEAIISAVLLDDTAASFTFLLVTCPDQTDTTPASGVSSVVVNSASSSGRSFGQSELRVITDTSGRVRTRLNASTADHYLFVITKGWIDRRDRT